MGEYLVMRHNLSPLVGIGLTDEPKYARGEDQWPSCPQVPTAVYTTTAQLDTEAAEARRKWRRRQRRLGGEAGTAQQ